jgi:hypothetical protein
MKEALHDVPLYREFAGLDAGLTRLPGESTILRFRHLLEAHDLSAQLLVTINDKLTARCLLLKSCGGRCDIDRCAQFDQEPVRLARPGDASGEEGQSMALRYAGAYRRRCRFGSSA